MGYNIRRGFTLIEALMTITIIAVLSTGGAYLMVNLVRNYIFIPNQMNMDMLASEAIRVMIDGDALAKGLRFSKQISAIPSNNEITFVNQDSQTISYQLSSGRLYRSIAGGGNSLIPYYASAAGVSLSGASGQLFTYYDASEALTSTAAAVRRIKIDLVAQTGTGSYADWEGLSQQSSAVAVKKFQ